MEPLSLPYKIGIALLIGGLLFGSGYAIGHVKGNAGCQVKDAVQTETTVINAEDAKNEVRNNPPSVISLSRRLHSGTW